MSQKKVELTEHEKLIARQILAFAIEYGKEAAMDRYVRAVGMLVKIEKHGESYWGFLEDLLIESGVSKNEVDALLDQYRIDLAILLSVE